MPLFICLQWSVTAATIKCNWDVSSVENKTRYLPQNTWDHWRRKTPHSPTTLCFRSASWHKLFIISLNLSTSKQELLQNSSPDDDASISRDAQGAQNASHDGSSSCRGQVRGCCTDVRRGRNETQGQVTLSNQILRNLCCSIPPLSSKLFLQS